MPQKLLDRPEIRPAFQQVRGKGVPERVRADFLRDRDLPEPSLHEPAHGPICQSTTAIVDEDGVRAWSQAQTCLEVGPKGPKGDCSERNDPFFSPFTQYSDEPGFQVNLRKVEGHEFRAADPGPVEKFQEGAGANRRRRIILYVNELTDGCLV